MTHLETIAPHYWNKPETANCTVVIPVPHKSAATKLPDVDAVPCLTFRLHREYLCAKSLFLRGLFSGASPHALIQSLSTLRRPPSTILHNRLPHLLSSQPSHPTVFLPVPDPASIQPLFYWMYFGKTDHIENALDKGEIKWEGLARNVEYLALSTDIKIFLGRWYRTWYLHGRCSPPSSPCPMDVDEDEDEESDLDSDGDESDVEPYYSSASSLSDDDDECERGRTRDIKPLLSLCSQLRIRTV